MTYQIEFTSVARRDLAALPQDIRKRVDDRILALAETPRPPGMKTLQGRKRYSRILVGDYRVIYSIEDDVLLVLVVRVRHRREAYR